MVSNSFIHFILNLFLEADLNASFTYLHQAQGKLQDTVRRKFEEAVLQRDKSQVER